jgi:hypothetical protein
MSAFARKHGWNVQRMAYWRDRVDEGDMAGVERAPGRFLPAVVVSSPASPARGARIVFPSGVAIEVEQVGEIAPDWIPAARSAPKPSDPMCPVASSTSALPRSDRRIFGCI